MMVKAASGTELSICIMKDSSRMATTIPLDSLNEI